MIVLFKKTTAASNLLKTGFTRVKSEQTFAPKTALERPFIYIIKNKYIKTF
jgi:hypothetical protein